MFSEKKRQTKKPTAGENCQLPSITSLAYHGTPLRPASDSFSLFFYFPLFNFRFSLSDFRCFFDNIYDFPSLFENKSLDLVSLPNGSLRGNFEPGGVIQL